MATVLPQKPAASAKYDAFVEEQLDRARRRIRVLDVSSALLVFAAGTLAYAVVVGLLDRRLTLDPLVRQLTFSAYALAAIVFLVVGVLRPLFRRINPYYAARAVEDVLPGSKNSLVNWLDLHDETLPPAIRASLGQRAAKDLGRADLEQAISGRRAVWLTAVTALFVCALFGVLVTSGTSGFGTLLARTFAPFGTGASARSTQITLVRPTNGDAVLGVGQPFNVAVRVEGRVPDSEKPDALKLLFRYRDGEPSEEQALQPEVGDLWTTVVPPSRTFNGFTYQVTGGDGQTPEYRVTVRSTPLVERFEVTYHYRPYTGWPDNRSRDANLRALRGTEAELVIHTNRPVKEGRLEVETGEDRKAVPAELIADAPQAMRTRLILDHDGQYRVWFTTTDNDSNLAALPYTIRVDADQPPRVELTKPGSDVTLPANGTLRLEGSAADDIGIKDVTLKLRQFGGAVLRPKPFRPEKSLRLGAHGYPKTVDYLDFIALDQLKDEQDKPFATAPGLVIEYWLEATDACDYPAPQRSESKHFKVTLGEPKADKPQSQNERDKAAEEQKKHDQEQDEKLNQEEQRRKDEAAEQEKKNQAGDKAEPKAGERPQPQPPDEGKQDLEKTASEAKKALDQKAREEQSQREKCDCKGAGDGKGQAKGDNPSGEQSQSKGGAKSEGQQGQGQSGAGKGEGTKDGQQAAANKPEGGPRPDAAAAESKGGGQGAPQSSASAKPDGPPQPDTGGAKGQGQGPESQHPAAAKEHGTDPNGAKDEAAAKGAGQEKPGEAGDKAAAKGDQPSMAKAAPKPDAAGAEPKGDQKGEGKPQGETARAEGKSGSPEKGDGAAATKDDPKKRSLASELARHEENARRGPEKERADAEKWLNDLARNAGDQKVRDLARKIGDEARKDRDSSPALPKGPPRDEDGPPCECKGGGQGKSTAAAKGNGKDGDGKRQGVVQSPQGAGRNSGAGRDAGPAPITAAQKELLQGLKADEAEPAPADPQHRRRPGVLQVEDFRNIDPSLVKDLGMTPEQWEAFKRAYVAKQQRDETEQLPGSRNDTVGNRGASEYKGEKNGSSGDRTGLGQVPPELRELFREYTRRQAEKK